MNTFSLKYLHKFSEVISSIFTSEKDGIDSPTESFYSCDRTLRSRRDRIIIECDSLESSYILEAMGKSTKESASNSNDFCIDTENMTYHEDRENIANIVFSDQLDLVRLHKEIISLIESNSIDMIVIPIRDNCRLRRDFFEKCLNLTPDHSMGRILED